MMKKIASMQAACFILSLGIASSFGQAVSDQARRHFDRGLAAVEMAKTPDDYEVAIKEFDQAIRLAPDWPDVYYNLGLVQEKAEKYGDAVTSLKQYLRLAPAASDFEAVKSLINKLEFKAEQFISDSEALDIFASLGDLNNSKWKLMGEKSPRGTAYSFRRVGDRIEFQYFGALGLGDQTAFAYITGRNLEYYSAYNDSLGGCRHKVVMEIVSRTKIKCTDVETREFKSGRTPFETTFSFEYILK